MTGIWIESLSGASSHLNRASRWLNEQWGRALGYSLGDTLRWCEGVAEADGEAVFGAGRGDALVGVALLVESDLELEPDLSPWLSGLYVAPSHRGRRIGELLIDRVEHAARSIGHERLYLYCRSGQLEDYYRQMHWHHEKPVEVDGQPFVVMSKALEGHAAYR